MTCLETRRLRLLPFADDHLAGLNALNADPEVMRFLAGGRPESLDQTRALIQRVRQRWREIGYSWWSLVDKASGEIIGAGALQHLRREASPQPDPTCPLEFGWRLRRDRWGRGLATEAGRAIGRYAFEALRAPDLLAVCDPAHTASENVMKRLGMTASGRQRWYGKDLLTYRAVPGQWSAADASTDR